MNSTTDDASESAPEPLPRTQDAETSPAHPESPAPRGSATGALALLLALAAAFGAGYAVWRLVLIERGDDNVRADLSQRLDALDTRLGENERRAARNNELAATLREQLSESERLRDRMREDLVALADRGARAEALLADLTRRQRGTDSQLSLADAGLMLAQADARLRLFGDRQGAGVALELAERALADAGMERADLQAAVADARAALAADRRPGVSALLSELDALADAVAPLPPRSVGDSASASSNNASRGWWARQFDRLDHLITVRREIDTDEPSFTPTKDGVRRALARARLAALEQDNAALPRALESARAALQACCDAGAIAPLVARLDRLITIDWQAPMPDLGALRERLDNRTIIEQAPDPVPEPLPEPATESIHIDDDQSAPAEEDAA